MPLKFILLIVYVILVGFLLFDHARTHDGKIATVKDFRNAIFNAVKSHEGLIFVATVFYIGCLVGTLLVFASGNKN